VSDELEEVELVAVWKKDSLPKMAMAVVMRGSGMMRSEVS
jgi:hypothetical protein